MSTRLQALLLAILMLGCSADETAPPPPGATPAAAPITNRVDVPGAVRQNLGITFAKAEERSVAQTLRLAGHFELAPSARQPFHAGISGVVTLHVSPLQPVEKGQLLASITSSTLIERRHELHVSSDAVGAASDDLTLAAMRLRAAKADLAELTKRNRRRQKAGAPSAELEARESSHRRAVRVMRAEKAALARRVVRSKHRFEAELLGFATLLGVSVGDLEAPLNADGDHGEKKPGWEAIDRMEVRAARDGVVASSTIASGAWVDKGAKLFEAHDSTRVRLVARVLHSDIGSLAEGQKVVVVPPRRSNLRNAAPIAGVLRIDTVGDPIGRTTAVFVSVDAAPPWARAGTAAFVEATVSGGAGREIAIPAASLVRDGLQHVFFRRDPKNPDKVIRVEAERGASDGHWVVVFSGVTAGDEVVVDGAYELKLASSKRPSATGHFHADGTFHAGDK